MASENGDTVESRFKRLEAALELQERREMQYSKQLLVCACIIMELGLILATAAALLSDKVAAETLQHPGAWPTTISAMVSPWDTAQGRIFFGLIMATGVVVLSSKYAHSLLKVETVSEQTLLDVIVPVGIIVIACVPIDTEQPGEGNKIMSNVHSVCAGVVFVVAPVLLLVKSIPRRDDSRGFFNTNALFRANYVLSRSEDVLFRVGRHKVRYAWWMMAAIQVLTFVFFGVFQYFNGRYASKDAPKYARFHVLSFVAEFLCITGLFVSFLLVAAIANKTRDEVYRCVRGSGWVEVTQRAPEVKEQEQRADEHV